MLIVNPGHAVTTLVITITPATLVASIGNNP